MARTDNLTNYLTDVATAIKEKKGDNSPINISEFDTEIINLPSGGEPKLFDGSYDREGLKQIGWTDEDVDYYNKYGAEEQCRRQCDLRGEQGDKAKREPAGALPPAGCALQRGGKAGARDRLQIRARLQKPLRGTAVPALRADRQDVLRAVMERVRGEDQGAHEEDKGGG